MFVACSASAKHSPLLCCFAAYSTIKPVSCRSAEQMFAQNLAHNAGSPTAALCAHSQGSLFPRRVVPRLPAHLHAHRTSRQVTTVAAGKDQIGSRWSPPRCLITSAVVDDDCVILQRLLRRAHCLGKSPRASARSITGKFWVLGLI